jgi:BolA family transcriptional regulator, general stress-responsive regulator
VSSPDLLSVIETRLRDAFHPVHLDLVDESRRHAGHAGARGGGRHVALTIVSDAFEGLLPVARHRKIHAALAAEMGGAIHALAIGAWTPAEWDAGMKDRPRATTIP